MKISTAQSSIVFKYPRGRDWPERGSRMRGPPAPTLPLGPSGPQPNCRHGEGPALWSHPPGLSLEGGPCPQVYSLRVSRVLPDVPMGPPLLLTRASALFNAYPRSLNMIEQGVWQFVWLAPHTSTVPQSLCQDALSMVTGGKFHLPEPLIHLFTRSVIQ